MVDINNMLILFLFSFFSISSGEIRSIKVVSFSYLLYYSKSNNKIFIVNSYLELNFLMSFTFILSKFIPVISIYLFIIYLPIFYKFNVLLEI